MLDGNWTGKIYIARTFIQQWELEFNLELELKFNICVIIAAVGQSSTACISCLEAASSNFGWSPSG